jgi:hypothetical protein
MGKKLFKNHAIIKEVRPIFETVAFLSLHFIRLNTINILNTGSDSGFWNEKR